MRLLIAATLTPPLLAALVAYGARSRTGAPVPSPVRASASVAADALGDHYAALQLVADSVGAAQPAADDAPSELAQVTARNLAGRIRALADDYERGVSLWMRLALAQAALDLLEEDASRLAADPATAPADVRDLADRLSGVLELGRVTGRVASRTFGAPAPKPEGSTRASLTISALADRRLFA